MTSSVLQRVRAAAEAVAGRSTHVAVDGGAVEDLAVRLVAEGNPVAVVDDGWFDVGDDAAVTAFAVTWNTVNFGSGWFHHVRKRPGLSGARSLAAALRERFAAHGPWDAGALAALRPGDCAAVFGQPPDGPAGELMALFATALNELGALLRDRYGGRFEALVEDAGGTAEGMVHVLDRMPFFHDVAIHHGLEVPFFKRAQLTAADLHTGLGGRGAGRFADLDRLTIFADNLVPHVLRVEGALRHTPALAARIDAGELLEHGSPEEVEIRACAVHAAELLVGALRRLGVDVSAMTLDYALWRRGQQPRYKAIPRHRCRTVAY